jgi:putative membrane protein
VSRVRWRQPRHGVVLGILAVLFGIEFAVLAIAPVSRSTWLLENVIAVSFVALLLATRHRLRFSRVSYTMIFVFLAVHEVGAHYTYSLVPYDDWSRALLGISLQETFGFERNHFDRFVHFVYGLLLAYPMREVVLRVMNVRGIWGYLLPLDVTMSTSLFYELIEWGAAVVFGGDLGQAYLGTQGDIWDAHKDLVFAGLGATLAMGITLGFNRAMQRDFNSEWLESLRVKQPAPLGEDAIAELLEENS